LRRSSAPNIIENKPRNLPSKSTYCRKNAARLGPVAPPDTLGLKSAAMGNPENTMFINAIPNSAAPRRTSMEEMRSVAEAGRRMGLDAGAAAGGASGNTSEAI
jgi:hypothetical protein